MVGGWSPRWYFVSLKETLHDEPAKFKKVLKAGCDFRDYRITEAEVFSRMQETMKDHWKLLLGLTVFMPKDLKTFPPEEADQGLGPFQTIQTAVGKRVSPVLTLNDAIEYMASVEEAFRDQVEKYDEFLKILFTAHRFDDATVIAKVEKLMKGHRDLLLDFTVFLSADSKNSIPPKTKPTNNKRKRAKSPKTKPTNNKIKCAKSGGSDFVNKPKTRSQTRSHELGSVILMQHKSIF